MGVASARDTGDLRGHGSGRAADRNRFFTPMFAHLAQTDERGRRGGKLGAPVDSRSVDTRSIGRRPAHHPLVLPVRLRVLPLLAAALLALAAVSPVLGHAELVSSDPANKAVLDTPPTVITLTFDEGVVGKS